MGCILNAIEEDAYDEYVAECKRKGTEPEDWYTFRGHARQYIEKHETHKKG